MADVGLMGLRKEKKKNTHPSVFLLIFWVRGRRQAHNPTLAKILRLTYNRNCSHNRPQTAACNAVCSISRRALLITRLGEQLPRPRQVSMVLILKTRRFWDWNMRTRVMGDVSLRSHLRCHEQRGVAPLTVGKIVKKGQKKPLPKEVNNEKKLRV